MSIYVLDYRGSYKHLFIMQIKWYDDVRPCCLLYYDYIYLNLERMCGILMSITSYVSSLNMHALRTICWPRLGNMSSRETKYYLGVQENKHKSLKIEIVL